VIYRIRGLQVVNGGQTIASIHRASKVDKFDVSRVAVAMKLTRVAPSKLGEFVPLIAKYANTQNVIQVADLSANNEFHIRFEQLASTIWYPGEESRWFYERARGSYQVAAARFGTTFAKKRDFELEHPKDKRFGKTDLAKYLMAWWGHPHLVCKGAQKNFTQFMSLLSDKFDTTWAPDETFFKEAVALAILYQAVSSMVRKLKLESYSAQVTTYIVALLSAEYSDDFDLSSIWARQAVSDDLVKSLQKWAALLHAEIISSARKKNVGEWCKNEVCWNHIRSLKLPRLSRDNPEFGQQAVQTAIVDIDRLSEDVKLCVSLNGNQWAEIMAWASRPNKVSEFDRRVAHTVMGYALKDWSFRPTDKQAKYAARVARAAIKAGVLEYADQLTEA
jgi:hypothetical protein